MQIPSTALATVRMHILMSERVSRASKCGRRIGERGSEADECGSKFGESIWGQNRLLAVWARESGGTGSPMRSQDHEWP
ncbi:hypothetical protein E2562_037583 [Oryza meyeriana var. granulata]|uniref:Uncharacterized protein n=1 Tax=Oryza meyeriana var. granulata TaxID=110450 RepID=A0A6G1ETR6_9ORYZ|nr:hypothetical protein E2562_037583 [Oryza meyeriana var. granulata]